MKLLLFFILCNFAYAQTQETETTTEQEKQEEQTVKGPIENPFNYGPYKGDEYVPFDRLRREKEESKEQREEEEAEQSQI